MPCSGFTGTATLIRNLYNGFGGSKITVVWDGKNQSGEKMASGIYFIRINENVLKVIMN